MFKTVLGNVQHSKILPPNLGVHPDEWEEGSYAGGEHEIIKIRRKEVQIHLPFELWYRRAVAWAQALTLMVKLQEHPDID